LSPPLPEHLFERADATAANPMARQTDLRRAISDAYYGLFHFTLTAATDMVVGETERSTARYSWVYRSIDHSRLRTLCSNLSGTNPKNVPIPPGGFGPIAEFARLTGNLYLQRILADYDPSENFTSEEATVAVSNARQAIKWFKEGTSKRNVSNFIAH
jgi:hypothetical protein